MLLLGSAASVTIVIATTFLMQMGTVLFVWHPVAMVLSVTGFCTCGVVAYVPVGSRNKAAQRAWHRQMNLASTGEPSMHAIYISETEA
jgi:hypothetical protein